MDIKDRIKLIMEQEQMQSGAFAETIGVQQSTLSHVLNGRNKPSLEVVTKIHQAYNQINLEWLLYGIGNMTTAAIDSGSENKAISTNPYPSLFDENSKFAGTSEDEIKKREEITFKTDRNSTQGSNIQEIRYIEKPPRKITEIRIFFDDNTFEIFRSEK